MKTWNRLQRNIGLIIAAAILAAIAAVVAYYAACLWWPWSSICRHVAGPYVAALAAIALVLVTSARRVWHRLDRRLSAGLYARPSPPSAPARSVSFALTSAARVLWEGEARAESSSHPMIAVPPGYGWRVAFEYGRVETVLWYDLWEFVKKAWEIDHDPLSKAAGLSYRSWPGVTRAQWQARVWLLRRLDYSLVRPSSGAVNAKLVLMAVPWRIMSELYECYPPNEL